MIMDDEKKNEKKRKRFAARLKSSKGIICVETPGRNIVLCNVGQGTGLDKVVLYKLINSLSQNLSLPKLILEKGETYSFLIFSTTADALLFFDTFNGKVIIPGSTTPIHMCFVDDVPNKETICQYDNPNGLVLLNDIITIDEENLLFNLFDHSEDTGTLKNRQVSHYGYEFRYGSNDVDLSSPLQERIPEECAFLWQRLKECGYDMTLPDQLTVNKYYPGHGIPTHVDKHSPFGDTILSLSLGSDVLMDWKHYSGIYVPMEVPARSIMIMSGESRYDWQHGIQPRSTDPVIEIRTVEGKPVKVITNETKERSTRISLTFRWTRSGPCNCSYKTLCDSVTSQHIDDHVANSLEELHVHQVYEQIAGHFSTTRHKPWPKVVEFMNQVPAGAVVLDLGSGNGKNILRRNDILQIACERSSGLLDECKEHIKQIPGADCVRFDLLNAGVKDGCADVVICIAVIHHFSSRSRRLQSISTIARLLRTNGQALITVWARDQKKSNYLNKNKTQTSQQKVSVNGVILPVHENRTDFQHNDLLVPWKLRSKTENKLANTPESTLLRYYHVFEEKELGDLCRQVPGLSVENSFYEEGNWCVICKKISS